MIHPNESAFPIPSQKSGGLGLTDGGLTKREYMATHALVGFLIDWAAAHGTPEPELAAQAAVAYADALIAELSKPKKED